MNQDINVNIRPLSLEDFIGQQDIKNNLNVYIESAKIQKKTLDHIMLYGGPGKGKTSLASIISKIMNGQLKTTNGPSLQKVTDITSILAAIKTNDFLFIDEIHRINKNIEEILYSAMEDYVLDLIVGEGSHAKIVKMRLPYFTVIGATTKYGLLSQPFRNRFGITFRFEDYNNEELSIIIKNFCKKNNIIITDEGSMEIAIRGKKTPRICLNLCKRIIDFMYARQETSLSKELVIFATKAMGIDKEGLEQIDRNYLKTLSNQRPLGIQTISAALQESENTIEDTIEPYLLRLKFIEKTPRGRIITMEGLNHIYDNND